MGNELIKSENEGAIAMSNQIAIIGAGPGGYVAAIRAAQLGGAVTVIESDNVGGTCLNWGCIPSKIMKATADKLEDFRRATDFGLRLEGDIALDMSLLASRKKKIIMTQAGGILNLLKKHKIAYLKGKAVITGMGQLRVHQDGDGVAQVDWDKLIIATGSRPIQMDGMPFDGSHIISSNDILHIEKVPQSIIILGGGVIGCEFAFILASMGSEVTLVEALPRLLPLPSIDISCSKVLQREMKKKKIRFLVNRSVTSAVIEDNSVWVTIGSSPFDASITQNQIKPETVKADKLLLCVGRQPNTDSLGLETIGLEMDEKGWIPANEQMETYVKGIYAIGDVLGPEKVMLAHVASHEGMIAAENAMGGVKQMDYRAIPNAIFTSPEVANVGLSEMQAKDTGHPVRSDTVLFRNIAKSQVMGEIAGEAKLVSRADNKTLLGVHIVGPHATELIAEATLVLQMGGTVNDFAETIHAHPTLSEVMMETALKALDRALLG
jgi:dihydrolipoamide dehydrogenase